MRESVRDRDMKANPSASATVGTLTSPALGSGDVAKLQNDFEARLGELRDLSQRGDLGLALACCGWGSVAALSFAPRGDVPLDGFTRAALWDWHAMATEHARVIVDLLTRASIERARGARMLVLEAQWFLEAAALPWRSEPPLALWDRFVGPELRAAVLDPKWRSVLAWPLGRHEDIRREALVDALERRDAVDVWRTGIPADALARIDAPPSDKHGRAVNQAAQALGARGARVSAAAVEKSVRTVRRRECELARKRTPRK